MIAVSELEIVGSAVKLFIPTTCVACMSVLLDCDRLGLDKSSTGRDCQTQIQLLRDLIDSMDVCSPHAC